MKPDIIVTWPTNCDYPLWREMIETYHEKFHKIIIVFHESPGFQYRQFIEDIFNINNAIFINDIKVSRDWRHDAITTALKCSTSPWVWFTEQDCLPDDRLWEELEFYLSKADLITYYQGERMHPCSLFIKRELLNKTSLDFAAQPPEYDHFGSIQKSLIHISPKIEVMLGDMYLEHANGYSHNFRLLSEGQEITYEKNNFMQLLKRSLSANTPLHPHYAKLVQAALKTE